MPTIPLHVRTRASQPPSENPLPPLLHTPSGLAILELQGTFHFPTPPSSAGSTQLGKLVFPLYNPLLNDPSDTKWMKRVYMYVGKGQRMTGEVKKLAKPLAVVTRTANAHVTMGAGSQEEEEEEGGGGGQSEELEIVELVSWKIVFSSRPEPVGAGLEQDG
ncbi:hypothetical protein ACEQ8H_005870 [Pleosporales sp. CAS-2024a]